MAATIEDLEKRLAMVEEELACWRQSRVDDPARRGAWLFYSAQQKQLQFADNWVTTLNKMGISGQPMGAEKVQQLLADAGIEPEANEFSRGLIEMREE